MTEAPKRKGVRRKKNGEVVNLYGGPLPNARQPDLDVIRHLEWLLERAKAGEIVQTTVAYGFANGSANWCSKGQTKTTWRRTMIGALADAQFSLLRVGEDA